MNDNLPMTAIRVWHFGPSTDDVGGMASVLRDYAKLNSDRMQISIISTYTQTSRYRTVAMFLDAFRRLLVGRPRPEIAHLHVSQGGSFLRKGILAYAAKRLHVSVFITVHGSGFVKSCAKHPRLVARVLCLASGIAVLTTDSLECVRSLAPGVAVRLLPNAVSIPDEEPSFVSDSPPLAVFAGEVGTRKGVDVLLRAWRLVRAVSPSAELVIAGPGGDLKTNETNIDTGVRYVGPLPPERISRLLSQARCAVLPSRAEAMPIFLLEAAAMGRPLIATDVGSMRELVTGRGFVVDVDDEIGLADALTRLLLDPKLAAELGQRAFDHVKAHHSSIGTELALAELYDL